MGKDDTASPLKKMGIYLLLHLLQHIKQLSFDSTSNLTYRYLSSMNLLKLLLVIIFSPSHHILPPSKEDYATKSGATTIRKNLWKIISAHSSSRPLSFQASYKCYPPHYHTVPSIYPVSTHLYQYSPQKWPIIWQSKHHICQSSTSCPCWYHVRHKNTTTSWTPKK